MRSGRVSSASRLVVLDFDGTVAVGDAPVQAYLDGIVELWRAEGGDDVAVRARSAFPSGVAAGPDADGYAAVARWARASGVPEAIRSRAYGASRTALHEGRVEVSSPAGLAALLDARPAGVRCVLVTNAPVAGIEPLLDRLGLGGRLDGLIGDAGKPEGLPAVLDDLLGRVGVPVDRLLAVGDVWANDLAPAAALGAATALVDRYGRGDGSPTFRAPTLDGLLPDIARWWSS